VAGTPGGPATTCGRLLRGLGATAAPRPGAEESVRLRAPDGRYHAVTLPDWPGERALRGLAGVAGAVRRAGDRRGPAAPVGTTYLALRAAAAALAGVDRGDPGSTLDPVTVAGGLVAGLPAYPPAAVETLRCADGWLVARWRDPDDRRLFEALLRAHGRAVGEAPVAEAIRLARECRLLVAPVRPARRRPPAVIVRAPLRPGRPRRAGRPGTVVDWTPLWAGPWLCEQLALDGARVVRVEPPGVDAAARPSEWGRGKLVRQVDARTTGGRAAVAALLRDADVLVYAYTARARAQLGFTDAWLATHAPETLRLSLTAFDPPADGAPGLGEHAAAAAGLLWNAGHPPLAPLPWADPLLGAWGLLVLRACLAAGVRSGHLQLSLEAAAGLATRPAPGRARGRPVGYPPGHIADRRKVVT
jgi:hypothetical protein